MSTWLDPNLLSLVGLGSSGDADLPDGRHLRWFMGAPLGFPRSGFRLRRHVSKALANWEPAQPDPLIRAQFATQSELGAGTSHRFPSGLTVGKVGGLLYEGVLAGNSPILRIDKQPVTLDFGQEGAGPTFPPGALRSNPAAFVRLTVHRRRLTGSVTATGFYNAQGEYRFLDRAGSGFSRPGGQAGVGWEDAVATQDGFRLHSRSERGIPLESLARRDREAESALGRAGRPLHVPGLPGLPQNPWVAQTLLLDGGWLEHIELVGRDAALSRVQWIPARAYAQDAGWVDVDRFFLPLTDAPDLYPVWTTAPADAVVKARLMLAPPRRNVPWDDPSRSVNENLAVRYRGESFLDLDDALRLCLKGELDALVPQSVVEVTQTLESVDPGDPDPVDVRARPFEHACAAAADPQVARVLGLLTTDTVDPAGVYDYLVEAQFPRLWVEWALFPEPARHTAEVLKATGSRGPWPAPDAGEWRPDTCLALATAIRIQSTVPPDPPADLAAEVVPDVIGQPVQAHVELSWQTQPAGTFENGGRSRVFYALVRQEPGGMEVLLHHQDDDGLLLPHLPTQRQPADGRLRLLDRTIPAWGAYTWRLAGMDLWGRFSADGIVTAEVRDTIPPPPPTALEAILDGSAANAPVWEAVQVAFDWTAERASLAPDLDRFEIHLRQGDVARSESGNPATWGHFEHSPSALAPPVVVQWPSLALDMLPAGTTGEAVATAIAPSEGGGQRVTVRLGPVHSPLGVGQRAAVSATVRAVDRFGNTGAFGAHAPAQRFGEVPPAPPEQPDAVQLATRGDALGRCAFKVSWPDLGAGRVRVLCAPGSALLAAAESDMDAYAALDQTARGAFLRGLALEHREVFRADHEYPYPASAGEHVSMLSAADRSLTVFTIEPMSAAEVRAPWPADVHAFIVVAVPAPLALRPPLVEEVRPGDRHVTLRVAPDLTGATASLQLHRTRNVDDLADLRRMRRLGEVAVGAASEPVVLEDDDLYTDLDYWYCVVAVAADGQQSQPSAPIRARPYTTQPPPAPTIVEVVREGTTPVRHVTCLVPRRDLPLTLARRRIGQVAWQHGSGPHVGPGGRVDIAGLTTEPVAEGYRLVVADEPTEPDERYMYRLRLRDPAGRTTDSQPVEETP